MPSLTIDKSLDINSKPKSEKEAWGVHLKNRWWRLNNLYWIKNKHGNKVRFRPNSSQENFLFNAHGRDIILKLRQRGFTTLMQIVFLDECMFNADTNAGVVAHNRDDAIKFFKDKVKYAYDRLAPYIRDKFPATNDTANELRFENGSVMSVGTSLRSGTYQLLHVSEYGKVCSKAPDKAIEIQTGAMETVPIDGWIVIESTAEGRIGDFYDKCTTSLRAQRSNVHLGRLDYKIHFYPWYCAPENRLDEEPKHTVETAKYFDEIEKTGVVLDNQQIAWHIKKKIDLQDNMGREHPTTPEEAFQASVDGAYFSSQIAHLRNTGRICRIPIDPYTPIETFWDLGRDTTVILFFQKIGFDYRFINYYEHSGEGMDFYLQVLASMKDGNKPYIYGDMYLPHDGTRKSMMSVQGMPSSPAEVLHNAGYSVRVVTRTADKQASINQARRVLPQCYFDIERCDLLIQRLESYRKERVHGTDVWKPQPMHDIASHGSDGFMTFSDGYALSQEREDYDMPSQHSAVSGRNQSTGY